MNWLLANFPQTWELTTAHLYLSLVPTVLGVVLALGLGLIFGNRPRSRAVITSIASAVFTIPSLALFVVIPTQCSDRPEPVFDLAAGSYGL